MEPIRYITDVKGNHSGLLIDFDVAKKTMKKQDDIVAMLEDIEDIVAMELGKNEKSFSYEEARQQIFGEEK
jgi:hypothetical protein